MKLTKWNKNVFVPGVLSIGALALLLVSGCVVRPDGRVEAGVVVAPPAVEVGLVPDDYYWDGYEYVGLVGDQYYYLGSGNVWLVCDPVRLDRVHAWVRIHPDWHEHIIRNDHYRNDSHGHFQPRRENKPEDRH